MNADREADATYDIQAFAEELRRLADALEAGEGFTIDIGGETVSIPSDVDLSVSYELEDGEGELEFQLGWSIGGDDEDDEDEEDEDGDEETSDPDGDPLTNEDRRA